MEGLNYSDPQQVVKMLDIKSAIIQHKNKEIKELKYEYIEGQNNLIIYLREAVKIMVHEGKDFGDIVHLIQTVKPIFKHD